MFHRYQKTCKILAAQISRCSFYAPCPGCPSLSFLLPTTERSNKSLGSFLFKIQCLRTNSHVHVHCKPYNLLCQKLKIVAYSRNLARMSCVPALQRVCLSSCRLSHESNHRPGVKAQIFLRCLPGGPPSLPFFPFSPHPLPRRYTSPPARIYLAASARRSPTEARRQSRRTKRRTKFDGGSSTGGVVQNVQVPQGGGRGIRIGPQGLPLHHR